MLSDVLAWLADRAFLLGMLAVFALLIGGAALAIHHDTARHDRICRELFSLAETRQDTITIRLRCEVSGDAAATVVPVPVFVPSR